MNEQQPDRCKGYDLSLYPLNLGLGPRAELMLYLLEETALKELFTRPLKEILEEHKKKINLFLKEIPGLLALLLAECSIRDEVNKISNDMPEAQAMLQAINDLLNTNPLQRGDTLQKIMQEDYAPDNDFKNYSTRLWESGYPLLYHSIPDEKREEVQKLFKPKQEGGYDFLSHLGNWSYRDLFSKPKSASTNEQTVIIRMAKSLGVLTLNGEMGNACCCRQTGGCRETEIVWFYCMEDEEGECVAFSNTCDDIS